METKVINALYRRYSASIRRWIAAHCPEADVYDIEVSLWERLLKAELPQRVEIRPYLKAAAKNEVAMYYRHKNARKRRGQAVALPDDDPSDMVLDERLRVDPEMSREIDHVRLRERWVEFSKILPPDAGNIMRRSIKDPASISRPEHRRMVVAAKRAIEQAGVQGIHEPPSFLGHVVARLKAEEADTEP